MPSPAERLRNAYNDLGSWANVGKAFGISAASAHRIANGHIPKSLAIRKKLGMTDQRTAITIREDGSGIVVRAKRLAIEWGITEQDFGLEGLRRLLAVIDELEQK